MYTRVLFQFPSPNPRKFVDAYFYYGRYRWLVPRSDTSLTNGREHKKFSCYERGIESNEGMKMNSLTHPCRIFIRACTKVFLTFHEELSFYRLEFTLYSQQWEPLDDIRSQRDEYDFSWKAWNPHHPSLVNKILAVVHWDSIPPCSDGYMWKEGSCSQETTRTRSFAWLGTTQRRTAVQPLETPLITSTSGLYDWATTANIKKLSFRSTLNCKFFCQQKIYDF